MDPLLPSGSIGFPGDEESGVPLRRRSSTGDEAHHQQVLRNLSTATDEASSVDAMFGHDVFADDTLQHGANGSANGSARKFSPSGGVPVVYVGGDGDGSGGSLGSRGSRSSDLAGFGHVSPVRGFSAGSADRALTANRFPSLPAVYSAAFSPPDLSPTHSRAGTGTLQKQQQQQQQQQQLQQQLYQQQQHRPNLGSPERAPLRVRSSSAVDNAEDSLPAQQHLFASRLQQFAQEQTGRSQDLQVQPDDWRAVRRQQSESGVDRDMRRMVDAGAQVRGTMLAGFPSSSRFSLENDDRLMRASQSADFAGYLFQELDDWAPFAKDVPASRMPLGNGRSVTTTTNGTGQLPPLPMNQESADVSEHQQEDSHLPRLVENPSAPATGEDTYNGGYGEHPAGEHPSRTLFVRNINSNVEDKELLQCFEQYGPVRSMYTQCKHRGFVMVSYNDIRHAKEAMKHEQGRVLRRRKLDIHYSIPKENSSDKDHIQGTLVVFNLDPNTTVEELREIFSQFGEVKEVRETPNKKHHKFVEFYDTRDAERAMQGLNRTEIRGKVIKIEPSRPGTNQKKRALMEATTGVGMYNPAVHIGTYPHHVPEHFPYAMPREGFMPPYMPYAYGIHAEGPYLPPEGGQYNQFGGPMYFPPHGHAVPMGDMARWHPHPQAHAPGFSNYLQGLQGMTPSQLQAVAAEVQQRQALNINATAFVPNSMRSNPGE